LLLINCNNRFQFALEKLSSAIKLPSLLFVSYPQEYYFLLFAYSQSVDKKFSKKSFLLFVIPEAEGYRESRREPQVELKHLMSNWILVSVTG